MQPAPTIIVIFGITGDLSRRKLIPALLDLFLKGYLPKQFKIVGFSRRELSKTELHEFVHDVVKEKGHGHTRDHVDQFLKSVEYVQGDFNNLNHYEWLGEKLVALDEEFGVCANKLYYLAVPPNFYENIFQNLAHSGLSIPCGGEKGWMRILVEKPFGNDIETAQKLDHTLGLLFKEEQIFRIDHYLAKETLQNILTFRFSNALFEPVWDHEDIEHIVITLHESIGIEGRGEFYDGIGALRDVGQNHMLQMVALATMENPGVLHADVIRKERARVLQSLRLDDTALVRAQYKGYKEEKNIQQGSTTETFFRITVSLDNDRWRGVPIILESGKKLHSAKSEISVYFKKSSCLCPPDVERDHQNILTFRIQPDEGISIQFWAKKPGFGTELEPKTLSFLYKNSEEDARLPDAYERVLYDCIRGDQTLFTSTEEMEAAWKFITPALELLQKTKLVTYEPGSKSNEII